LAATVWPQPVTSYLNIDFVAGDDTPTLLGFYFTRSGYSQTVSSPLGAEMFTTLVTMSNR